MNLKSSNCDETYKLKLWWNSITQIVRKLKNSKGDKTQKVKLWKNSNTQIVAKLKTQIVTKIKLWEKKLQNSKCDKTQIVTNLENSNYDNNSKTQIVRGKKLKNSNCMEKIIELKKKFCGANKNQPLLFSLTYHNSPFDKTWNVKNFDLWRRKKL